MVITIKDALNTLGISAYCKDNDYDTIVWTNPEESVSKKDLESKVAELQKAEDAVQYQRNRETSYPSIQEQLDMQYWDAVNGTKKWQEAVAKVKTDNPKPE